MDSGARNRLRLWLRSEKALGLPSVVVNAAADSVGAGTPEADDASPPDAPEPTINAQSASPAPAQSRAADDDDPDEPSRVAPPPAVPVVLPAASRSAPAPRSVGPDALFSPAADQPAFDAPPLSPADKRARLAAMDDKEVR